MHPSPHFEWLSNGTRLPSALLSVIYNLTDRSALSVLAMIATAEDNQKIIECRVKNIYTNDEFSESKQMEVWFQPIVRCESEPAEPSIGLMGGILIIACSVRGNPQPTNVRLSFFSRVRATL